MRPTTTQAWAAALAVMSLQGPFTTAEAAPAQQLQSEQEPERPKYYLPRHVKRQFFPDFTAIQETSSASVDALAQLSSPSTSSTTGDDGNGSGATNSGSASTSSQFNPDRPLNLNPFGIIGDDETASTSSTTSWTTTSSTTTSRNTTPNNTSSRTSTTTTNGIPPFLTTSSTSKSTYAEHKEGTASPSFNPTLRNTFGPSSTTPSSNSGGLLDPLTGTNGPLPLTPAQTTPPVESVNDNSESTEPSSDDAHGSSLGDAGTTTSTENPSFNPPRPNAATGGGFVPTDEPTPTAPPPSTNGITDTTDTASEDNTTSDEHDADRPIIVGLSTVLEGATPDSQVPSSTSTTPPLVNLTETHDGILPPSTGGAGAGTGPSVNPPPTSDNRTTPGVNATSPTTPAPTPTARLGIIPSIPPQVSSALSGGINGTLGGNNTAIISPGTVDSTSALSWIASSLSSEISSIVATETDPLLSSSMVSQFSSLLSSAASSLAEHSTIASVSATATDASVTGTSTGAFTLSTSIGSSGITVIPVPVTTTSTSATITANSTANMTTFSTTASATSATATLTTPSLNLSIISTTPSETGTSISTSTELTTAATTSTEVPASTTETTISQAEETTTSSAPHSIVPTATDTETSMIIPTSIVFAPTTTESVSATASDMTMDSTISSAPSGIPTAMPRLVQPPGGMPTAPANAALIQVGFNYALNFPFVVSTNNSASQIFAYLPCGLAYAVSIDQEQVVMKGLMPYDTTAKLSYITTLAQAYIPGDMVEQLAMALHQPLSDAYNNPDPTVNQLMSMINPTVPILPGANMDDGSVAATPSDPEDNSDSDSGYGGGAPIGGDSGSSQKVSRSAVGIGVGAVAGAAIYAAAMVYVARRYRKKRRSHQRASSVGSHGDMTQRSSGTPGTLTGGMGGYFMSGGNRPRGSGTSSNGQRGSGRGSGRGSRNSAGSSNNRSVREQGISAPIMAENSLGWD